jgi:serine/threonine-protein kinase
MELLEGTDLGALLRKRTTLPIDEASALLDDVARGLAVAHGAGIIHRDLKPSNLFQVQPAEGKGKPIWKILDFGVSRLRGSRGTLTEGAVVGTPGYMSPEQAQGKDVQATADVFSLGAVLYRALTGRRPFGGSDVPQILYQVVFAQPPRPRDVVPSLPRDVEAVLAIALAKRPSERFASAQDFATAFRWAIKGRLPEKLRARAHDIVTVQPWAATVPDDQKLTRLAR